MAVIVTPKFNKQDIRRMIQDRRDKLDQALLFNLKRVGEGFVKSARNNDTYKDQTGNLRSSIGYVILKNGQQMFESFLGTGGPEGVSKAKDVIEEVKGKFPRGYVLIGVAGMDYAAAVEAKGFDVITASTIVAETDLKIAIKRIASKTK